MLYPETSEVINQPDPRSRIPSHVRRIARLVRLNRERRTDVIAKCSNRPSRTAVVIQTHSETARKGNVRLNRQATGVNAAELDVLRVHLDTARYHLLARYPALDTPVLLNCLLLAATDALAVGDHAAANYHFAWFQVIAAPPGNAPSVT